MFPLRLLFYAIAITLTVGCGDNTVPCDAQQPVGHWPLKVHFEDRSGLANNGVARGGLSFEGEQLAFDGIDDWVEVRGAPNLNFGSEDFTVAAWVYTDTAGDDVIGDVLAKFDVETKNGFSLGFQNFAGVTSAQPNHRNLYFGVDGNGGGEWEDVGRPGNSVNIFALAVHLGELYAGTYEAGAAETGHVYRYDGGQSWTDCGALDASNTVVALAVHDGSLYAGTGSYDARGSRLLRSENTNPGGRIFRLEQCGVWTEVAAIENAIAVFGLGSAMGSLWATTMYEGGRGLHKVDLENGVTVLHGSTGGRPAALAPYNGRLFVTNFSNGNVSSYVEDEGWVSHGEIPEVTQTYSTAIYEGELQIGTWPKGAAYTWGPGDSWTSLSQLGMETEIMPMLTYNGSLFAGTLPRGQVYRYDGNAEWSLSAELDSTPDVPYRRVWSMAVFRGKLFAGTLPSGRVHALESGTVVTLDRALPGGWHHVVVTRGELITLFVDGVEVAQSRVSSSAEHEVRNDQPLQIGLGPNDHFKGRIADLRLYKSRVTELQAKCLAGLRPPKGT